MKRLVLIRHAKSSWENLQQRDFERPLNKRGEHDAPLMGEELKRRGIHLDHMLASPATRAITTARSIAKATGFENKRIEEVPGIYEASPDTLLQLIRNLDKHVKTVALVGHNPGLTMLANRLGDRFIDNIPTCGVVILDVAHEWSATGIAELPVRDFIYPKMFK